MPYVSKYLQKFSSMELALYVINNTLKCVIPQELDQYAQP